MKDWIGPSLVWNVVDGFMYQINWALSALEFFLSESVSSFGGCHNLHYEHSCRSSSPNTKYYYHQLTSQERVVEGTLFSSKAEMSVSVHIRASFFFFFPPGCQEGSLRSFPAPSFIRSIRVFSV